MADTADQIKAAYVELAKLAPSQDWERILKVAKKILGFSVNEKKAFHCKVVCLIYLDKFDEALTSIERFQDASDLSFEKAYCEYRLNKIEDAYATLQKCTQMDIKEKELLAQVTYRLEKYQESYDAYKDIIKNTNDDFDNERQTNLAAVIANLRATGQSTKDVDMSDKENQSFELCYNSACISLSKGNLQEAHTKLKRAEIMCRKYFEDDQGNLEDPEGFEHEIVTIRTQLAYCLQKLGRADEALKIYNGIVKSKPSDLGVMAVTSNNLVCINKDQNVFDSKKKIKAATAPELDSKLNSYQRKLIAYNEILFTMATNQNDTTQKLLKQFETKFDDKERYSLLRMSQLYREKKLAEAEKQLTELAKKPCSNLVKFYLIQLLLTQGKINEAVDLFKSLEEYKTYRLGIVSAVVTLLKNKNDKESVTNIYNSAIEHFSKTNSNSKELDTYVKENSNFQIASGNMQKACEMLEKMRSKNPNDFKLLSKLINIYSKFDTAKAKNLSKELPSLEDVLANSNIDIDGLESQFGLLSFKTSKLKSSTGTGQMKSPDAKSKLASGGGDKAQIEKEKKKKKRKIKLPKNYDPKAPIDPERWIPLRERSYYKGKRNKKKNAVGKGTQGAVSSRDNVPQSPNQGASADTNSPVNERLAEKLKQQKQASTSAAKQQQQKKKKKGPKW